ncbi:phenylalanine--tRNA ligase subunit beta [Ornithinimicrobium tianjinense]|uniref:Phenylalanine--tRNA ligase beta subunit n=1 Tax=Ornithinimicrobium tianjinense TaxID=1195761 RepID=A0A917F5K3_9MICO|nr:phenylalanine--tRNA ligase subunit beta [Ornithinimicrobium tianjinense]GGF48781.1 phenylalanine--tRNA ligase beta subunit [Ornithinimicrobium tianjinense]
MRVPVDWLGEYVELPAGVTGEQIAAALVAVGLEEEGLHGGDVAGPLVVGRVLEKHPEPQKNGKTINWCQVDVGDSNGTGEPQGIVCGAHNFEVGDLVAVILPGGVLPGNFQISARKTYGHVSAGMICSVRELGIGEDHDGIIVLPRLLGEHHVEELGLQPGDDLIPVLGLDREVVEVNVTPDRGYCFSLRGVAREYSHSTGAAYTDPALIPVDPATQDGYAVELADAGIPELDGVPGCDRYVARIVRGIDLTRETPEWMQRRLLEAGMRPISLAVDVTNYVMLALGQPLHAFDLATLQGPIVVRRAVAGERLRTLDDVDRVLDPEDLLITDSGTRILALAGVMGGEDGEVTPGQTTDVLIESAHFDPRSVARSSRRHRLSSEAAKRFERGVDPDVTDAAAQLAVNLLVEHGGGTADPAITDADQRVATRGPIELDVTMPTRYVGVDYTPERVREILTMIGCEVRELGQGTISVTPPGWRPDLTDAPTLVEEVARVDGYDKIPSVVPRAIGGRGLTHGQRARRRVAGALAGQGLHEVLTYPFVGESRFDELGLAADDVRRTALRLANPLSDEAPLMRTELLQTLPEALRRNISRGSRDVALFEIDTVTLPDHAAQAPVPGVGARPDDAVLQQIRDAVPGQPWHVAVVAAGQADRSGWWGKGRPVDVTDVVAWAHSVADTLGVPLRRVQAERAPFHPGRCVELTLEDGTTVGFVGELHPKVVQRLGLPDRTSAAELDLDVLVAASERPTQVRPLSTHPMASSDVALVVPRSTRYGDVEASLRAGAGELLESVELFDVYVGDQLAADQQSLAFRMHFRAPDRTLTTEEVNAARDAAVARAAKDHGAVQR